MRAHCFTLNVPFDALTWYKRYLLTLTGKRNAEFKLLQSVLFYAHHKWLFLFIVPASNVNRVITKTFRLDAGCT